MGRPPCCEKSGVKKGPWSPEEDLLLVSYVKDNGTGNWRDVPANTGLMRCSKSCRLRWTNYLRPGIKRGNFSDKEVKLIIGLQKLLGNRWSAIASYMTDRTDNDIKNYWNSHLKKKLVKPGAREVGASAKMMGDRAAAAAANKGQWERRLQTDFHTASQAFQQALSIDTALPAIKLEPLPLLAQLPEPTIGPTMYAFSTENIAHLLKGWMSPSAIGKASVESMSSVPPVSDGGEGGEGSHNATARMLEVFTGMTKVEGAGGAGPGPSSSFPMLENWLFDDGMGHGDVGLSALPLADPGEFF